jgi:hypothetical protein
MASKDLMYSLSRRLEPIRAEFNLRLYHWSSGILEQQVASNDSLFWRVPSRVIRNLHQFFRNNIDDRLHFFLIGHGCCHHAAVSSLGQPVPSNEEVLALVRRCADPSASDIRQLGLLPLATPVPRLNRRKLHKATRENLAPLFDEMTDPAEPDVWLYEAGCGPWRLVLRIYTSPYFQLDLEFDVLLGMGDLYLERQLSLHRLFGIGPSSWDLCNPGEEGKAADLLHAHAQFMVSALSGLLADLNPGISRDEGIRAETEWKQWLNEVRAQRATRPSRKRERL